MVQKHHARQRCGRPRRRDARRAVVRPRDLRRSGVGRRAREAARHVALPRARALQAHEAPVGGPDRAGDGSSRRGRGRVHDQGVHGVLRPQPRHALRGGARPSLGDRARARLRGRGRRGRARRDPRGARRGQRQSRRPRARGVRPFVLEDPPARRADPRNGGDRPVDRRDRPLPLPPRALRARKPDLLGRGPRPRRARRRGDREDLPPAPVPPDPCRAALGPSASAPARRGPVAPRPRAGPRLPRRGRPDPVLRPALRREPARHRARRRHVLAALPAGPREAGARVLDRVVAELVSPGRLRDDHAPPARARTSSGFSR